MLLNSNQISTLRFGEFALDRASRRLLRGTQPIALSAKAFDLLVFLVENPGRPLSKDALLRAVWSDAIVEESNLTQNVFLLRKALGTEGQGYIATLPGRGYQFTAHVEELPLPAAESPAQTTVLRTVEARHSHLIFEEETEDRIEVWRSPMAVGFVAAGLVLLVAVGWLGWQRYEDRIGGPPVQVVLADFDGSTGDPVLDRTLKDVLRFELGQSPFVTVVPPTTVRTIMTLMRHGPDDRLTMELARDLCERTGSQAVLHGELARIGNGYVVTQEATNCVDGATLGIAKQEVTRSDELPRALDRIGSSLRHDLGESRRMIARFNKPLAAQHTGSLEALKDFSQAAYLSQSGYFAEAIDLLKQAVAVDPQFAAAYFNLAAYSSDVTDPVGARAYLQKAYDLRNFTNEPARLAIVATYQSDISGDLYASLRNDLTWAELYPRSAPAWNALANVYLSLHRFPQAVVAAQHQVELIPANAAAYNELAVAQMNAGDLAGARKTCDLALSRGLDVELIHTVLLSLGHLVGDAPLIAREEQWTQAHPGAPVMWANEAAFALDQGRLSAAQQLYGHMEDAFRQQGNVAAGIRLRQIASRAYFELGWPEEARAQLNVAPVDPEEVDELVALVETAGRDAALSLLQKEVASHPQSTLWSQCFAPLVRAKIDLLDHKPAEGLAVMAPMNGRDLDSMGYTRGMAYMETHQFPQAEEQFRTVLDHPGIEPESFEIPLAKLQLARALAGQGKKAEAQQAYEVFLAEWSHADSQAVLLQRARAEAEELER